MLAPQRAPWVRELLSTKVQNPLAAAAGDFPRGRRHFIAVADTLRRSTSLTPKAQPTRSPAYRTSLGAAFCGDSRELLREMPDRSISLVMTSPPFALQRQKSYGNLDQADYIDWLVKFGRLAHAKLADDGSFVLDLGGAYQKGVPVRSLYNYRVLIRLCDEVGFHLAEEFFWHNPLKLPSPIEWVNKRKIRAKDSVNSLWWLSKSEWPKADVSKVRVPHSDRRKKLLRNPEKFYRPAERPSGHDIGKGFGRDNGGAIPSNLQAACKAVGAQRHPARFPPKLPKFFIEMLTERNDLVVDIFAGSNTTGEVAESLGRRWLAFEQLPEYVAASAFRFAPVTDERSLLAIYQRILDGGCVDVLGGPCGSRSADVAPVK
jgi:DNA modification methylase